VRARANTALGGADLNSGAKRARSSRLLLALLAGLYPSAFFASNNWYGFDSAQVAILICGSVALAFAAVCVVSAPLSLALRWQARRRAMAGAERLPDAVWGFTGVAVALALSSHPLSAVSLPQTAIVAGAAVLALGGATWAYRSGLRGLNVLLLGLTVLTAGQWTYHYLVVQSQLAADQWFNARRATNEQIRFERTPNVYYVLAESYPSRSALEKIFAMKQPGFYRDLEHRGFEVHHEAFSNYHATIHSMASLFAMEHHYERDRVGNLDAYGGRDVISARVYNAVVDVFERNGYLVEYLHATPHQVRLGADVDYLWPAKSASAGLEEFLALFGRKEKAKAGRRRRAEAFRAAVDERLASLVQEQRPRFTYIYTASPGHSDSRLSMANVKRAAPALEEFRRDHPGRIKRANQMLMQLLDRILAADPGAVIVVGGDHGAWGWRVEQRRDGTSVAPAIVALDRLGILIALRFPDDYDGRFRGDPITNVNLFRYVFAYLTGSDDILEQKAADDGYVTRETTGNVLEKAVENARVLEEFGVRER